MTADSVSSNFTLGNVQAKIYRGQTQEEVAIALGSPNIITKGSSGHDTWIYDKVGSSIEYCNSSGGFWLVIVGTGRSTGVAESSQRTLTVVIKFDSRGEVDEVTYNSSKF